MEDKMFLVYGRITDKETGLALMGLTVKVYDKDFILSDFLGETVTHRNGNYQIRFKEIDFSDMFGLEHCPDLYLKIYSSDGKMIYNSKDNVVMNAGVKTEINLAI